MAKDLDWRREKKTKKQAKKISDKKERKNNAMKKFNVSHNTYRNFNEERGITSR